MVPSLRRIRPNPGKIHEDLICRPGFAVVVALPQLVATGSRDHPAEDARMVRDIVWHGLVALHLLEFSNLDRPAVEYFGGRVDASREWTGVDADRCQSSLV